MRKIIFLAILSCTITGVNAQDFNKWSIDLGAGLHNAVYPISPIYKTDVLDLWQANLGVRYMINESFGLRLDFGFNKLKENSKSNSSFESDYYRGTVEAVVNAGKLLGFRQWTQSINVLVHGGVGLSGMKFYNTLSDRPNDRILNAVAGITPQIKLTEHIALFLDFSVVMNSYQNTSFDGDREVPINGGFNGQIFNGSIGLNIYLGKNNVHADWHTRPDGIEEIAKELKSLEERMQVAETEIDELSDRSEYDKDVLISELDGRYAKIGETTVNPSTETDFVKQLLNKGYQNVYFDFGKSSIQKQSLQAVNYLYKYMSENPSVTAELTGYADEIGSASSNQALSTKRAKRVYDVLIASGISSSRLSYNGNGEDASVDKNSKDARQLVRRVTFTIK